MPAQMLPTADAGISPIKVKVVAIATAYTIFRRSARARAEILSLQPRMATTVRLSNGTTIASMAGSVMSSATWRVTKIKFGVDAGNKRVSSRPDDRPLRLIPAILALLFKSRAELEAQNLVLRQQINVLRQRMAKRLALTNIDRLLFV
jgi:hypothetical protein